MGFYTDVILPFFYDTSMDSTKINEGRKSILRRITEEEILEIGFGTGINVNYYPESVKKIIGIDVNKGMLNQFRKKLDEGKIEVELLHRNGETIPFHDSSLNAVVSTYTLCTIKNVELVLKEIHRILKPDGKFYFLELKNYYMKRDPKILGFMYEGIAVK